MSTLTDRYVWAVVRLLPEEQRPEIDRELHELIAEMTDARQDAAPTLDPDQVEHAVLTELGDPSRIASRYVEQPRALVSHEVFPEYLRVLKLVAFIAVPIVTTIAVIGEAFADDPSAFGFIGAVLGAVFSTGIQVAFWVTLVYAFADRWKTSWTTDDLPDLPSPTQAKGFDVSDAVFGIVMTVLVGVALVWQHARPLLRDGGEGVPLLHPDIWNGPGQVLLAILAASAIVQAIALARRRWTFPLAWVNLTVNLTSLAVIAWLALDERLFNTRFFELVAERAEWDWTPTINQWVLIAVAAAIEAWDSFEAFRNARRNAHSNAHSNAAVAPPP